MGRACIPLIVEVRMPDNTRWVVEYPEARWAVEKEERQRVSDVLDTQAEAIRRGHEIVRNLGGGELIVKGRDGQIRDKITVAPGNDDPGKPG
jgi:hypothetical protein